jgi:hypothetical protein
VDEAIWVVTKMILSISDYLDRPCHANWYYYHIHYHILGFFSAAGACNGAYCRLLLLLLLFLTNPMTPIIRHKMTLAKTIGIEDSRFNRILAILSCRCNNDILLYLFQGYSRMSDSFIHSN